MTSIAQESAIFDFDFTGLDLNTTAGGTKKVSTDSVFRIGSISKLFTVYAFLLHGGLQLWERSGTEFIPELRDISRNDGCFSDLDVVRWEEVTLGSLASHMSGIGRDCEHPLDSGGRKSLTYGRWVRRFVYVSIFVDGAWIT